MNELRSASEHFLQQKKHSDATKRRPTMQPIYFKSPAKNFLFIIIYREFQMQLGTTFDITLISMKKNLKKNI